MISESMSFVLESPGVINTWQHMYDSLPEVIKSPFFNPGYYVSYKCVELAEIECFSAWQDSNNFLFYPYLKKSINQFGYVLGQEYYDISGAYGYNGPTGIVTDSEFLTNFNQALQKHLRDSNVVTEFVRYCPVTANRIFHTYTNQIDVLDNVYVDLSLGLEWIWKESFESTVRKNVRKAESYGLITDIKQGRDISENDLALFLSIYTSTMTRNEAADFYYFPIEFYNSIIKNLGDQVLLATTFLENTAISTEIVLMDGQTGYSFLGGTLSQYNLYRANTYLRWEIMKHLFKLGVSKYSLGGSAVRGDGVYNYKKRFARGCENPFYIGTYVHLPEVYAEIQSQWRDLHPQAAQQHTQKIQGYRITE